MDLHVLDPEHQRHAVILDTLKVSPAVHMEKQQGEIV